MIDIFAIGLTHALLALMALRLMQRGDLDADLPPADDAAAPLPKPPGPSRRG